MAAMTSLLDEAIARVRELPESEQERAADVLMQIADQGSEPHLTPEQVAKVEATIASLRDGTMTYLTDEEVGAMWKRFGL